MAAGIASPSPRADQDSPPDEIRLLRTLIELRNLPGRLVGRPRFGKGVSGSIPLFEQILSFGFCLLGEAEASEVAFGLIDQSWKLSGGNAVELAQFSEPGFIKIAANLLARPARNGTFLTTQNSGARQRPPGPALRLAPTGYSSVRLAGSSDEAGSKPQVAEPQVLR